MTDQPVRLGDYHCGDQDARDALMYFVGVFGPDALIVPPGSVVITQDEARLALACMDICNEHALGLTDESQTLYDKLTAQLGDEA